MNNGASFKIQFKSTLQATKFIGNTNTGIGGIKLMQQHKEKEIDPTIHQCWGCGILNPQHNSFNCPGPQICLKCGSLEHKFFDCRIPREYNNMTAEHLEMRYCSVCKTRGDHT